MSDRVDILLLELLDLAREQRTVLSEGDLDGVLSLMNRREEIAREIQGFGRDCPRGRSADRGRRNVKEILEIDDEIASIVQAELRCIAGKLEHIENRKKYSRTSSLLPSKEDPDILV